MNLIVIILVACCGSCTTIQEIHLINRKAGQRHSEAEGSAPRRRSAAEAVPELRPARAPAPRRSVSSQTLG